MLFQDSILNIFDGQEGPADKIPCLYGLEPSGFNWVSADSMHPANCLLSGWQVIHTIGLFEGMAGFHGRQVGLPLALWSAQERCSSGHGRRELQLEAVCPGRL